MTAVEQGRKRLFVMLAVDGVCAIVAIAALLGAFFTGHDALFWVFGAALSGGFAAQIWFIAGFKPAKQGV
jgi:hypothetical protein